MVHGHLEIIMIMSNEISFIYTYSFSFRLSSRRRNYAYDYKLFCIPTSALTKISFQSSSYVVYIEVSVTTRWLTKIQMLLNDGFVIMNAEKKSIRAIGFIRKRLSSSFGYICSCSNHIFFLRSLFVHFFSSRGWKIRTYACSLDSDVGNPHQCTVGRGQKTRWINFHDVKSFRLKMWHDY